MSIGAVRVGGFGLYPFVCSLVWLPDYRRAGMRRLAFGRERRYGRRCGTCGAIVLDPDGGGEVVPGLTSQR